MNEITDSKPPSSSPPDSDHKPSSPPPPLEFLQPLSRGAKKTVAPLQSTESIPRLRRQACRKTPISTHQDTLIPTKTSQSSDLQEISSLDFKDKKGHSPPDNQESKNIALKVQGLSIFRTETIQVPAAQRETLNIQRISQTFLSYQEKRREWWASGESENPVNCVVVYNLEHRVDEEILYELFCKVGQIKRMKLFRLSNTDINSSPYLKSLNIWNPLTARPHKKRALIEYHAPNYAEDAIKVFNHLKLYNRRIFVAKYKNEPASNQIHFVKSNQLLPWFDQYFCLDYFSEVTNLTRVFSKPDQGSSTRIIIHFPGSLELEQAKEALQTDLAKYLDDKVAIYYKKSDIENIVNIEVEDRKL